ncbi:unnamed protein product [Paramecium octaurelia]|uniref:Uncharacterized protein n=1 Tax=Paramecium octaurelia TaxID=43137 RepID=A0A8S1SYB9_PAROT|nr:unnamed protein product [Paramecium octaurelia]
MKMVEFFSSDQNSIKDIGMLLNQQITQQKQQVNTNRVNNI